MKGSYYSMEVAGESNLNVACKKAKRCCLSGWIIRVYGKEYSSKAEEARRRLTSAIIMHTNSIFCTPVSFNDAYTTTFQDIQKVLEIADI